MWPVPFGATQDRPSEKGDLNATENGAILCVVEVHLKVLQYQLMPFQFITAIRLNLCKGSGCCAGIDTLASQLRISLAEHGRRDVERFDMRRVTRCFVETVSGGVREMEDVAQ
jgi:hypothetical protein